MNTVVCRLGRREYVETWQAMRRFTDARNADTPNEIWLLEHTPVYTLGLGGKREHVLDAGGVPVVHCDRGGQVTYHGPGQVVAYLLLDLRRLHLGAKELVARTESAVIDTLAVYDIAAERRRGAPGVYVGETKIAALGFRIRRSCCYHGVALNVDMNLEPFTRINPCGYAGLRVTQVRDQGVEENAEAVGVELLAHLLKAFGGSVTDHQPYFSSPCYAAELEADLQ